MAHSPDVALTLTALFGAFVLILLNAIFVAAEFAIVKVRRTRLEELAGQGIRAARISILCVDHLDETLSAAQLGITLVSIALGWIGELSFANLLTLVAPQLFPMVGTAHHTVAVALSFFCVSMLHVVLGEQVPKIIAIQDAERVALALSKPLRAFALVTRPFLLLFQKLSHLVLHPLGYHGAEAEPLSEQELKLVMKESREDGVISDSEAQIITRAFEFADKRVADIMVSAEQVDYLSLSRPLDQNLAVVKSKMHTRFPLCDREFDTVIGIVHMKDVWPVLLTQFSNEAFRRCCRPPIYVSRTLRQDQLMKLFQSCRAHLAIVREAEGKNQGMVTLEDVLEGLVGDIRDEHGN